MKKYEFFTEDTDILTSIRDYIDKGLGAHIKSKNFISALMASRESIASENVELFIELIEQNEEHRKELMKELGFKSVSQLKMFVADLDNTNKELTTLMMDEMSTYLVNDELTIREASYITFAEAIVATTEAFMGYILLKTYEYLKMDFFPARVKAKSLLIARVRYNRKLVSMENLVKVSKLPNDVKVAGNVGLSGISKVKLPDNFQTNLFNPIWSIRRWLVDNEKAHYDRLKEEQRLLELRLLELRTSSNPALEKRGKYFERQLSILDKQIKKIEGDL